MIANVWQAQSDVCLRYGVQPVRPLPGTKIGISLNLRSGLLPVNGMRYYPENGTNGWYIWAGEEMGAEADFFVPLHMEHLTEWCPQVMKFLALPPGWRFLCAPDYEDAWSDEEFLKSS